MPIDSWYLSRYQAPGQDKKAAITCQDEDAAHVEASNSQKA